MSGGSALSKEPQARPEALKTTTAYPSPATNNDLQQLALHLRKPTLSELFAAPEKALLIPEKAVPFTTPRAGATQTFAQLASQCGATRLVQFQRAFGPEPESRSSSTMLLPKGGGMMKPPTLASRAFLNRVTLADCDFSPERLPPRLRQLHLEARVDRAVEGAGPAPRSVQSLLELYRPLEGSNPRVFVASLADRLNRPVSLERTPQLLHGSVLIVDHAVSDARPLRTVFMARQLPPAEADEKHTVQTVPAETITVLRTIRDVVSQRGTPPSQALLEETQRTIVPFLRSPDTFLSAACRLAISLLERSGRGETPREAGISRLERLVLLAERGAGRPPAPLSPPERDVALLGRVARRDETILSGFQKVAIHCQLRIERGVADAIKHQLTPQPLEKLPPSAMQAVQTLKHYAHQLGQIRLAPASRQAVALQRLSEQLTQAALLRPIDLPLIKERLSRIGLLLALRSVCNALRKETHASRNEPQQAAIVLTSLLTQMQQLHSLHLTHFMAISMARRPHAALRQILAGSITELQRLLNQPDRRLAVTVDAFEELLEELTLLS